MAWVKWDRVISSFGDGGLNIGSLKVKNWALLGKWWWRFRNESDALWCKVIKSIYGLDGGWGGGDVGSRISSKGVWTDIIRVGKVLDGLDGGFINQFVKEVGDGMCTSFWMDKWALDICLRDRFPRLFQLESNKRVLVGNRGSWINGVWVWHWEWIRPLRGRSEGEFKELEELVKDVRINQDKRDMWKWRLDAKGVFSVKGLATWIEEHRVIGGSTSVRTVWNNLVPRKVNVFIWRASNGRIPVRVELDKKGIDLDSLLCPLCDNVVESVDHCLVTCEKALNVWDRIFSWWGVGPVNRFTFKELVHHTGGSAMGMKANNMWQATIFATGYFLWKNRNSKVFKGRLESSSRIFQDIQLKTFEWVSRRSNKGKINWDQWITRPRCCTLATTSGVA